MRTFVLIHGAGDVGWYWHLVEAALRARGHDVVAPDLPGDDETLTLEDYAEAVVAAVGDRRELVVVGQSFGAFTAPLVATRLPVEALVFVAGMVPAPGEPPDDWWERTGYHATGSDDPYDRYYHDVPRALATLAMSKARAHPSAAAGAAPWPLVRLPDVPTRFVLCTEDRLFPPAFLRRVVAERLGVVPDEIAAGHCVALGRPVELAGLLEACGHRDPPRPRWIDHYDDELRRHQVRLRAAADVQPGDRVLDVGCGTGQTTRDAARVAGPGRVVGVDISDVMITRARRLTAEAGLDVAYERADAEHHPFAPARFDLLLSRFGVMFFADPAAAFRNLAHAARPGARLVAMVWQREAENAWAVAIRDAIGAPPPPPSQLDPFSLADPAAVEALLTAAGFADVAFVDVHEPVFYGPDVATALDLVRDMQATRAHLAQLDSAAAERALTRLRAMLVDHQTADGVRFDSRAWIVTARRA